MPSLVVIGSQTKEKQRGAQCAPPTYLVPKDPSLNRVKQVRYDSTSLNRIVGDKSPVYPALSNGMLNVLEEMYVIFEML